MATIPPPQADSSQDVETLRRAHAEALRLVETRAAFLATISHEFREPMNGVLGMARLLRETRLDEEQAGYLEAVIASGETLITLVNDILDLSRIDAGQLAFTPADFALKPFFERLAAFCSSRAAAKGLTFCLEMAEGLPAHLRGDPGRLRQILINLAGNAVKFTDEGFVRLSVAPAPADEGRVGLALRVEDTGIGIPPEAAARLFSPYAQADDQVARIYGGSGLGLMIARRLARAMHGDVTLATDRAKGTAFCVRVELEPASGRDADAPRAALAGALLLIVDPQERTRTVNLGLAKLWGLEGRAVACGAEALAVLREAADRKAAYDFVLMDRGVADVPAETLALRIRDDAGHGHARLVLLAGSGVRGDAGLAHAAGFDAYLPSPVAASTLLECLQRLRGGDQAHLLTVHDLAERRPAALDLLVADDNPVNTHLLAVMLRRLGHAVEVVTDGEQALVACRRQRFDAVLMDVQMPVMDGLEATRRLRASKGKAAATPVIAITANAMQGDIDACREAGMDGHVAKPVDRGALLAELERLTKPAEAAG